MRIMFNYEVQWNENVNIEWFDDLFAFPTNCIRSKEEQEERKKKPFNCLNTKKITVDALFEQETGITSQSQQNLRWRQIKSLQIKA